MEHIFDQERFQPKKNRTIIYRTPKITTENILDGGFAMGSNLNRIFKEDSPSGQNLTNEVITSSGKKVIVPSQASSGTLNSGGLY